MLQTTCQRILSIAIYNYTSRPSDHHREITATSFIHMACIFLMCRFQSNYISSFKFPEWHLAHCTIDLQTPFKMKPLHGNATPPNVAGFVFFFILFFAAEKWTQSSKGSSSATELALKAICALREGEENTAAGRVVAGILSPFFL